MEEQKNKFFNVNTNTKSIKKEFSDLYHSFFLSVSMITSLVFVFVVLILAFFNLGGISFSEIGKVFAFSGVTNTSNYVIVGLFWFFTLLIGIKSFWVLWSDNSSNKFKAFVVICSFVPILGYFVFLFYLGKQYHNHRYRHSFENHQLIMFNLQKEDKGKEFSSNNNNLRKENEYYKEYCDAMLKNELLLVKEQCIKEIRKEKKTS